MASLEDIGPNEARLEDLLENIDDLVALATLEGRILYVNRAWRERLGYAKGEIEALSSYRIIHSKHDADVQAANERLLRGETLHHVERILVAKDGRELEVEGSLNCRFKDGKPYYVRAIFHDVSERRRLERMKDELIAIASHEMRNPLMAILNSLEVLQDELPPGESRGRRMADAALRSSKRLLDIINAYLDLAKVESGGVPFDLREIEVMPWVQRVLEINRPLGLRDGIALELESGPAGATVLADEDRLTQALTNLLSNAVKFSKPGGSVRVSVSLAEGRVRVAVKDTGPGIPEAFRQKVFGKFEQAHGHAKGGSGLGLAISKTIIERMAGTIGFKTEDGKGTTFFFDLPRKTTL